MSWRVLVTGRGFDATPAAKALLERAGCELVRSPYGGARFDHELGGDELVALLRGVDAYIAARRRSRVRSSSARRRSR
jgi:hypothetical protein